MFIGREKGLKFLQDKYDEKKGQLIVLYGRRRVGKTETLREFCRHKPHIFYSCTQSTYLCCAWGGSRTISISSPLTLIWQKTSIATFLPKALYCIAKI